MQLPLKHTEMISTAAIFIFLSLSLILCIIYNWRRRWLYYYSSKIKGPFAFPLIGSAYILINTSRYNICETLGKLYQKYNPIFKIWLGPDLYIFPSKPKDVEKILKHSLEKGPQYAFANSYLGHGLLTGPVETWKKHRRVMNFFFSQKTVNSYLETFVKNSKDLAENLGRKKGSFNIFFDFFDCSAKNSCDIFIGANSFSSNDRRQYFSKISRIEELLHIRALKLFQSDFFWKLSSFGKEEKILSKDSWTFINKIIENKSPSFLHQLVPMVGNEWSTKEMMGELQTLLVAATETSPVTQSFAMLMLALHPNIQKQVQKELFEIFGTSTRDPTLEDLSKMSYLERVIKETNRLFPPRPMIFRHVNNDIFLDSQVVPKGSNVGILIWCIHRDPTIWPRPLEFNPDRFLLDEASKMERYAFLPFSIPPRNCIGPKFANMSIKIALSTILRRFEVSDCQYKSIEDIKLVVEALMSAPNGFYITLKPRMD